MPLCKYLEWPEFMHRHIPQNVGFDALTHIFEASTNFGQIAPVHANITVFGIGRDMICQQR